VRSFLSFLCARELAWAIASVGARFGDLRSGVELSWAMRTGRPYSQALVSTHVRDGGRAAVRPSISIRRRSSVFVVVRQNGTMTTTAATDGKSMSTGRPSPVRPQCGPARCARRSHVRLSRVASMTSSASPTYASITASDSRAHARAPHTVQSVVYVQTFPHEASTRRLLSHTMSSSRPHRCVPAHTSGALSRAHTSPTLLII
jgi:hypothetical protein